MVGTLQPLRLSSFRNRVASSHDSKMNLLGLGILAAVRDEPGTWDQRPEQTLLPRSQGLDAETNILLASGQSGNVSLDIPFYRTT